MHQYIAVEGVIGAGKTTIAHVLADALKAQLLLEEFEENPFLSKFYENQDKFAFPLELSFLASRYHQVKQVLENPSLFHNGIVSDFVLYKSLVFASTTLENDQFLLYRRLFDIMFQQMPKPDLTIYIYHSVEQLQANIRKRGRDYEQNITNEYLETLNDTYLQYFKQLTNHSILILDGKKFDIIENPETKSELISLCQRKFPEGMNYL
jgi:deoxyguanosine kinase